jgi:hypothetical protein
LTRALRTGRRGLHDLHMPPGRWSAALVVAVLAVSGCGGGGGGDDAARAPVPETTAQPGAAAPPEDDLPQLPAAVGNGKTRFRRGLNELCRSIQAALNDLPRPEDPVAAAKPLADEKAVLDDLYRDVRDADVDDEGQAPKQFYLAMLDREREIVGLLGEVAKSGDAGAVSDLLFQNRVNRRLRDLAADALGARRCAPGRRVTI